MAISIINNGIQNDYSGVINQAAKNYSNNKPLERSEKIENKNSNKNELLNHAKPKDLINFLSKDEKKVLSEVFEFELNEKNPLQNFSHSNNIALLKGSLIDIKL